jgi:tetratricopeptide (TPR) repeat protein
MIDWRTHLASLLLPLAVGAALSLTALPAAAQPSAPEPGAEMEAQPALEAQPEAQSDFGPQSPEEEAALRQATLDALFERLAQRDDPNWANVENEIWLAWSKSGSPSMDLLLLRAGRAMDSGDSELALRHLDDLVRLAPDFAEGWNKRATVYFLLNEFGRSVADIERTLALEPRHIRRVRCAPTAAGYRSTRTCRVPPPRSSACRPRWTGGSCSARILSRDLKAGLARRPP